MLNGRLSCRSFAHGSLERWTCLISTLTTCLPDINVWVSLATEKHAHHELAKNWFQRLQNERLVFCRLTQLGFLRLLTNKHVMQGDVLMPKQGVAGVSRTSLTPQDGISC